jgi:hypothetical protein
LPNLRSLATCCVRPEPRPLPSTGVTRLPRYYGPIRHLTAPGPSVTGIQLAVPGHAARLPVLRALSLCTCCRHYPGTATGGSALLIRPAISAFPERVVGSACASSFSRLARRSLALRPAHSRCHQFVARFTQRLQPVRHLPDCSGCFRLEHFAGWDSHPLESAALARRTPVTDIQSVRKWSSKSNEAKLKRDFWRRCGWLPGTPSSCYAGLPPAVPARGPQMAAGRTRTRTQTRTRTRPSVSCS